MSSGTPRRWLSDETVFSFCSRFHQLSGHRLAAETTLNLFGHRIKGCAHDLPARIDRFAARFDDQLGSPEDVIRTRTILPYYLPLRAPSITGEAIQRLRGDGIGSLKFQLGLLTSSFRAHHPLKACPKCIRRDLAQFGTGIWHLPHQLPGAFICTDHDEPLWACTLKVEGIERFLWHLPSLDALTPPVASFSPGASEQLYRLANAAHRLWSSPAGFHFDPQPLLNSYLAALEDRGLASSSGRLRLEKLAENFTPHSALLREAGALAALPATPAESRQQLGQLFRRPRSGTHPIRHLAVITWLFSSWDAFERAYKALEGKHSEQALLTAQAKSVNPIDPALATDSLDELPRSPTTDRAISSLRPKRLHAAIRRRIVARLRKGAGREELAEEFGFSVQTIRRLLRDEPGLQERWQAIVDERKLREARKSWERHMIRHPTLGIKALRMLEPAAFAWLHRNDRAWLMATGTPPKLANAGNHSTVSWDERDRQIASSIQHAALLLWKRHPDRRLRRRDLLEAVPNLAPKLAAIDRLPLTLGAMTAALAPRKIKPRLQPPLI